MATQSRKRKKLFTGVYEDKYGIAIPIRGKEHRYPLGTPNEQLRKERDRLRDEAGPRPTRRGTIAIDAEAYLRTIPEGDQRENAHAELQPWVDVFGARASADLKPIEIKQQRAAWRTKGPHAKPLSEKHLNNMLYRLRAMYAANHGRELNPAADVPVYTIKYADARAIPDHMIDRIIDGMADTAWPISAKKNAQAPPANLAKLRFRVMRETGLSQAMLKRVAPHHLNLKAKTVYVEMRRKGRGVEGATVDLTDAGAKAFRALSEAGGLGHFSSRSLAQAWTRALEREKTAWAAEQAKKKHPHPWPLRDDARAYDLRHTFATAALVASNGDLEAVATLLRHASLTTTRRYVQAASQARARSAVKALNRGGRLP